MRQRGFTYIGVMLFVAMTSAGLATTASLWSLDSQREKEAELLFVGDQFAQAIAAYRDQTPAGQAPRFPQRLEDLLNDKRWPTTRRHLRQLYVDPLTGTREWGAVQAPSGGILGVYSQSDTTPVKRAGFLPGYEEFAAARSYRDWQFVYSPPGSKPGS